MAAQRARRDLDDLIHNTPADGLIAGIGRINGDQFDDAHARAAVVSYDYTVLAGTQGQMNHRKKDRLFALIERLRLPVVSSPKAVGVDQVTPTQRWSRASTPRHSPSSGG